MVTAASTYLFEATEKRFYFKNVSILIPESWKNITQYKRPKQESYKHVSQKASLTSIFSAASQFWPKLIISEFFRQMSFLFWRFKNLLKHSQADVIVAPPTVPGRDEPYTKQFTACGEKAEYIHFTPDFVLGKKQNEFGPPGRNFRQPISSFVSMFGVQALKPESRGSNPDSPTAVGDLGQGT